MKKRWMIPAAIVLALAAALFALRPKTPAPIEEISAQVGRDYLQAQLTYDAGTRTLRGSQRLILHNKSGQTSDEIVLRVYMNGEREDAVSVSGVTVNGEPVQAALDAADATVLRIDHALASGAAVEMEMTLMITHGKTSGASIVTLPAPAVFENGAWRTDAYDDLADPSYAQAFDCCIAVDGSVVCAMRGARDASFALCPQGASRERQVGGVIVRALAGSASSARALLDSAQKALESLEAIGLAYPFDRLTVAESETGYKDGMALSGLIAMGDEADAEARCRRITRLIARETFGILVESDPWQAPWLSHSLSSAAELLAYRQRKGDRAYETRYFEEVEVANRLTRPHGVTVGAGTAFFGSDGEMTQVLRDGGGAMLMGICEAVGQDAFLQAMHLYVAENAGEIADQKAFEAALLAATGSDWSGYLADELAW